MKKRIFTLMMAFLAIAGNAVWGQTYDLEIDLSQQKKVYEVTGSGSYRFYGENNYGIIVDRRSDATITLDGVIINVVGAAINLQGGSTPTFLLKGENIINSQEGPAIRVARDAEENLRTGIIFSEQSTGSLIVDANGNVGIGINRGLPAGDITINGGTIIIDGIIRDGTSRDRGFNMNGNAVVIVDEIDWHDKNISSGILFEKSTTGQMYGNVELKSPLDLTNNSQTASVNTNGHTLTLASGYTLKCDAEEDITGSGTVKAYRIDYDYGQLEGCSAQEAQLPTDYNRYGPSTEVILSDKELSCSTDQDAFVGWMKSGDNKVSTQITTDSNVPNATTRTEVAGAWIRKALTLTAEAGEEGGNGLVYYV